MALSNFTACQLFCAVGLKHRRELIPAALISKWSIYGYGILYHGEDQIAGHKELSHPQPLIQLVEAYSL